MSYKALLCALLLGLMVACGQSTLIATYADGDGDTDVDADSDGDGDGDCHPPCSWERCEECVYGNCWSYCDEDEWCDWGECIWEGDECWPPCDWENCEECWWGVCEYYCAGDERCEWGSCIRDDPEECDPVANTGCLESERCALFTRSGTRLEWACLPTEHDAPGPGEPCIYYTGDPYYGTFDNCRGGSWCMGSTAEELTCMKLCTDTDASYCNEAYPAADGTLVDGICNMSFAELRGSGILGCLEPAFCDPTCDQPCDAPEDICLPASDRGGNFATICIGMSRDRPGGFTGDACEYANGCQPGFVCMGDSRCHALCNVDFDCVEGVEPPCEFTCCGLHPGETGDETCIVVTDTEDTWGSHDPPIGICETPDP